MALLGARLSGSPFVSGGAPAWGTSASRTRSSSLTELPCSDTSSGASSTAGDDTAEPVAMATPKPMPLLAAGEDTAELVAIATCFAGVEGLLPCMKTCSSASKSSC